MSPDELLFKRWSGHCKDARHGSNFVFHRAIRKHGEETFDHEVLEICQTLEEVKNREIFWINECKSTIDKNGYNMREGGDGPHVWTDEIKERHRKATSEGTKRAFQDPEMRRRHKEATKIANNKPEKRKRNSEAQKIAQNRLEVQEKRSESLKRTWRDPEMFFVKKWSRQIEQIDRNNGNVIARFSSARAAARSLGLSQGSISNVARGLTKTAGGFCWRYVSDTPSTPDTVSG